GQPFRDPHRHQHAPLSPERGRSDSGKTIRTSGRESGEEPKSVSSGWPRSRQCTGAVRVQYCDAVKLKHSNGEGRAWARELQSLTRHWLSVRRCSAPREPSSARLSTSYRCLKRISSTVSLS